MAALPTKFTDSTDKLLREIISKNPLYIHRKRQTPAWSLRTAAIYIGVSAQAVSNWESGVQFPEDDNIRAIARVMNTTFEKLKASWLRWKSEQEQTVQSV